MPLPSLFLYHNILNSGYISPLCKILQLLDTPPTPDFIQKITTLMGELIGKFCEDGLTFTDYLHRDDNPFTRTAQSATPPPSLQTLAQSDLRELSVIAKLSCQDIINLACSCCPAAAEKLSRLENLPNISCHPLPTPASLAAWHKQNGAGCMTLARAFVYNPHENALTPVPAHTPIRLNDLVGYTAQKQSLLINTRRLIEGRTAANALLYGDRGTGKSSTVKALLNEFENTSLRLVQLPANHIDKYDLLLRLLNPYPLKFIIFIDDLSFNDNTISFTLLKALLEGGLQPTPPNIVVYVTSNRLNLIRESFNDRPNLTNTELHSADTMQEKWSLSDRFGIRLTYLTPTKQQYLEIVKSLAAAKKDLAAINLDTLYAGALAYAAAAGGFSPRCAQNYINTTLD